MDIDLTVFRPILLTLITHLTAGIKKKKKKNQMQIWFAENVLPVLTIKLMWALKHQNATEI